MDFLVKDPGQVSTTVQRMWLYTHFRVARLRASLRYVSFEIRGPINVSFVYVCRMVRPNWALPLSCVQGPTQNAVCMVRVAVLMGNVTWTAALKTATAPTLWTQHGMMGESQSIWGCPSLCLCECQEELYFVGICITCSPKEMKSKDPIWVRYFIWLLKKSGLFLTTLPFLLYNPSRLIGSAAASVISGEEQFEDYGEGEDVDFTPSSPCPEEDTRTNGFSDLGSSLPSRFVFELEAHALNTILGDTLGTWWS